MKNYFQNIPSHTPQCEDRVHFPSWSFTMPSVQVSTQCTAPKDPPTPRVSECGLNTDLEGKASLFAAATQGWDLSTLTVKGLGGKCEESFSSSYSQNNPGYPFQNSNSGYHEWQQSSLLKCKLFREQYFTQISAMIICWNIWYTRNTAKKNRVRKIYFLHLCYLLENQFSRDSWCQSGIIKSGSWCWAATYSLLFAK